jgi:hypothetical protein
VSPVEASAPVTSADLPNGAGAAAIFAAGIGALALALFAIVADRVAWFGKTMIFYKPTGPLSGVTTCAVIVWLLAWAMLNWRWGKRTVALGRVVATTFVLVGLSLVLTFPPFADLF